MIMIESLVKHNMFLPVCLYIIVSDLYYMCLHRHTHTTQLYTQHHTHITQLYTQHLQI